MKDNELAIQTIDVILNSMNEIKNINSLLSDQTINKLSLLKKLMNNEYCITNYKEIENTKGNFSSIKQINIILIKTKQQIEEKLEHKIKESLNELDPIIRDLDLWTGK